MLNVQKQDTGRSTPPLFSLERLSNSSVINEHPWILPYNHKEKRKAVIKINRRWQTRAIHAPKPEAGTTVGESDEKATCMTWYHKPSSEPENRETHAQCMQAKR
jgi:hypothetical protein